MGRAPSGSDAERGQVEYSTDASRQPPFTRACGTGLWVAGGVRLLLPLPSGPLLPRSCLLPLGPDTDDVDDEDESVALPETHPSDEARWGRRGLLAPPPRRLLSLGMGMGMGTGTKGDAIVPEAPPTLCENVSHSH